MDILKPIIKHITIPLYDKRENNYITPIFKELRKSQKFSEEKIAELQLTNLKSIINYAYDHSKFYKTRFDDNGISPNDINTFNDIEKIPILSKDDIRNNLQTMISDEYTIENLRYKRTGGSTSVPLKIYVDPKAFRFKNAATARHNLWAGYERGDKMAAIWGDTDKKYSFKEKIYNLLKNRVIYLDSLNMDDENILKFIEKIRDHKPKILMGHAHSLYIFACFVENRKITGLGIKSIISTAEMLYKTERYKIESVFGKILYNRYGCEELSIIASECSEHDGLHINAEGLYVEVLDGDNQVPGKLVITDLWNKGMPLIRYEIGDMATTKRGLCRCGRGLPRLGEIYGRTSDFLQSPDGKLVSGISILDTFTIHIPGIKQVQIIQDVIDNLHFKIVKDENFNEDSLALLAQNVRTIFGDKMKHETEIVDRIPQTSRGKYKFSICNIPPERDRD
jgi:phenylacetate-CoA ligase